MYLNIGNMTAVNSTKKCTKCGKVKPLSEFYLCSDKKTGKVYSVNVCKSCRRDQVYLNREKNPKIKERMRERSLAYYRIRRADEKFMERRREISKKCYYNNIEKSREHSRKYYASLSNEDKKVRSLKERARYKKYCDDLKDFYVRQLVQRQLVDVPRSEIPAEIIEAKRLLIKVKRKLKQNGKT
jgi:hypothetical protein